MNEVPLWRLRGLKPINCMVCSTATGAFLVRLERGDEREIVWMHSSGTFAEAMEASALVRQRLEERGWVLEWEASLQAA